MAHASKNLQKVSELQNVNFLEPDGILISSLLDLTLSLLISDKMTVQRPSMISLYPTSLVGQPITLLIQNISGHTIKEFKVGKGQGNSPIVLPLSYTGDYPFAHHVVGRKADGSPVYINGRDRLAIVPTTENSRIPLFLSNKGLFCFVIQ